MLIHLSSWPEIDERLKSGALLSKTVIVPIGSNEQHGPTGLLGTDWLCPEIIAHAAEKGDDNLVITPTFNIGMAQHHLAFPGTITLRPSTFMAAIADWVSSLTRHGFADWSFTPEPWAERPPFVLKLRNWWDLPGVQKLCEDIFPTGHGSHATPSEIAVTQAGYPDRIKIADYEPKIAPFGPIRDANDYRARFPDGRIGSDPAQATPEKGQRIIDAAVPALIQDLTAFAQEVLPVA